MSAAGSAHAGLRFDYTAVGHVTVDVLADGTRRAGGSALYSALQAARLGLRSLIVTAGVPAEVEGLLAPYRGELACEIHPAEHTTTLTAAGWGRRRVQRLLAWAGPIAGPVAVETGVLHLAPVARELSGPLGAAAGFVGLTPQGLVRTWPAPGEQVTLAAPAPAAVELARGCDALVLSARERSVCEALIAAAHESEALAAVTDGSRPVTVLAAGARDAEVAVAPLDDAIDDMGAGDVFAAALFVALARGDAIDAAVSFASAASAVRMSGLGPDAIGNADAIAERMRSGGRAASR
jgi:hypothetical protein